ncbi:MAG: DUF2924 domain-containing protein [Deltaproteobacteria bacterium]|nr:DUF2924 domain-containing protein [Deltaproteobacteria bacterium]
MTKKQKISTSADGKTWVMPEGKPKATKKNTSKKVQAAKKTPKEKKPGKRTPALASFQNRTNELVVTFKGTTHKATVNSDGTITVNDKTFNSPSRAGKEVTGREVDGWSFWSYEVPGEGLKKLDTLRKADPAGL